MSARGSGGEPPAEPDKQDDAIIGRAFRRSLVVFAVVALLAVGAWWIARDPPSEERVLEKRLGDVGAVDEPPPPPPPVAFVDVTSAWGIDFVHNSGARGEKLLPETMGAGVAVLDYDGDGNADLLFPNGTDWPEAASGPAGTPRLYRNDGVSRFHDVTAEVGLARSFYGTGVAVGDYDNDGDPDLFLSALGQNHMYRNDRGRFRDVTARAGVAGLPEHWSTSAGFFDYDNDGDLDLFVCNYVRWSRKLDLQLAFSLNGRDRAYGPPTQYEGLHPYLYRNEGDGRFRDVSEAAGVRIVHPATGVPMAKALGVVFVDVDVDGFLDVLIANDTVQNLLFRNRGDGTFEERGALSGLGFDSSGSATGAMGIDAAHYRNDAQLAVGIGNFANEMTSFYVSRAGSLLFSDDAAAEGIGAASRRVLSFGLFFFDYDLDGRLDLLQANGHLESEIGEVQVSQSYRQPAQLFWNAGPQARACFREVPAEGVGDLDRPIVGRGATYGDLDGDGDLDVVLTETGGRALVLRNDQQLGHHWLRVRLRGTRSNRDAIGARVEVDAGGVTRRRQVMPTRSYLSQVEKILTFGLGATARIEEMRILWPDGAAQVLRGLEVDHVLEVVQPPPGEP